MKKLIIIPLLIISLLASATNYYVKTGGNDEAAGTSDATAWANHPWMSTWTGSVTLAAGDTVFMNRGDTWSISDPVAPFMTVGQSGTSGNYIVTTAYGTGNKPLIKITTDSNYPVIRATGMSFLVFDNLHVEHNSSTFWDGSDHKSGFDFLAFCHDIIITNCEVANCPEFAIHGNDNCYNITIGDTTATSRATPENHSNHIHSFGYAGIGLEGTNEAGDWSNHKVYYNYVHGATRTGLNDLAYGIYFSTSGTSVAIPKYIYCRYNHVEDIPTWEGIDTHGAENVFFQDNYVRLFGFLGILIGGGSKNVICERNEIVQPTSGWAVGSTGSFIIQNGLGENVIIRDNILYYEERPTADDFNGIVIQSLSGNSIISNNKIFNGPKTYVNNARAAIFIGSAGEASVDNVVVENNFIYQFGIGFLLRCEDIFGNVEIRNNIVALTGSPYGVMRTINAIPDGGSLLIYNNTFIEDPVTTSYVIRGSLGVAEGGRVEIKNNIIGYYKTGGSYHQYHNGTIAGTFESDYNLYFNGSQCYISGSARNWATWTSTLGYDLNSPNSSFTLDPLLKGFNMYNRVTDFDLKPGSPAINAGTNLGIDYDIFGHKRLGMHDIGAIESRAFRFYKY